MDKTRPDRPSGGTFEVYKDEANEWRWRFKATNGRIIADSAEGYVGKDDCLAGIHLMFKSLANYGMGMVSQLAGEVVGQ